MANDERITKHEDRTGPAAAAVHSSFVPGIAWTAGKLLRKALVIRFSQFVIRHSSFVIRHSSFVIRHSSFVIRHSPFAIRHSPFVIRHSSFVIRHSSFAIHSPLLRLENFCNLKSIPSLSLAMMKPLALIWYQKLLPGSQLVHRLDALGYRVRHEPDAEKLSAAIQREGPLILLVDLQSAQADMAATIRTLKSDPATQHIAVLAFAPDDQKALQEAAAVAGADLVAGSSAVIEQLPHLLEQALRMD